MHRRGPVLCRWQGKPAPGQTGPEESEALCAPHLVSYSGHLQEDGVHTYTSSPGVLLTRKSLHA